MGLRWHLSHLLVKLAIWLLGKSNWYNGYWNYWREVFSYAERKGFHILPVHYYSPIPDTRRLPDDLWTRVRPPAGFDLNIDGAFAYLKELSSNYSHEYNKFPREASTSHRFHSN